MCVAISYSHMNYSFYGGGEHFFSIFLWMTKPIRNFHFFLVIQSQRILVEFEIGKKDSPNEKHSIQENSILKHSHTMKWNKENSSLKQPRKTWFFSFIEFYMVGNFFFLFEKFLQILPFFHFRLHRRKFNLNLN